MRSDPPLHRVLINSQKSATRWPPMGHISPVISGHMVFVDHNARCWPSIEWLETEICITIACEIICICEKKGQSVPLVVADASNPSHSIRHRSGQRVCVSYGSQSQRTSSAYSLRSPVCLGHRTTRISTKQFDDPIISLICIS